MYLRTVHELFTSEGEDRHILYGCLLFNVQCRGPSCACFLRRLLHSMFLCRQRKTVDRRCHLEESTIGVFDILSQPPIFLYHGNDNDDGGDGAYLPRDNVIKQVLVLTLKKHAVFNFFNITL